MKSDMLTMHGTPKRNQLSFSQSRGEFKMNPITNMSESEMTTVVEMLVKLAQDDCTVTISTETDGIGLDNAFRVSVKDEEGVEIATSGGNFRLSGALNDVYKVACEQGEKDDACKHQGVIIKGMEGWHKR